MPGATGGLSGGESESITGRVHDQVVATLATIALRPARLLSRRRQMGGAAPACPGAHPMISSQTRFYIAGGTLRPDVPSYVERQADADLYDALQQGEFCYILTSRQMGKSSLMARSAARLREQG